jgi:hypothetical protein
MSTRKKVLRDLIRKGILSTLNRCLCRSGGGYEDSVGIAMIFDDSSRRFARLDSDKYGKISLMSSQEGKSYLFAGLSN